MQEAIWTLCLDVAWSASIYEISTSENPLPEILPRNVAVELLQEPEHVWPPLPDRVHEADPCVRQDNREAPQAVMASGSDALPGEWVDGEQSSEDSDVILETYPLQVAGDDGLEFPPWHVSDDEECSTPINASGYACKHVLEC